MTDQTKKTLRQFQCRDYLWEVFEQMSAELGTSVDYLVNEAMRQYARSRKYGEAAAAGVSIPPGTMGESNAPNPLGQSLAATGRIDPTSQIRAGAPAPLAPLAPIAAPPPGFGAPKVAPVAFQPLPGLHGSAPSIPPSATQRPPSAFGGGFGGAAPPGYPAPPPLAPPPLSPPSIGGPPPLGRASDRPPLPGGHGMSSEFGGMTPMWVTFNGQRFPVNKEEFIIGRGSKMADLAIKDGNISRRHAAVVWQNGGWYMRDLGSTNGVEFQGRKVDNRHIQEGDVYTLCDYEIRFTYR